MYCVYTSKLKKWKKVFYFKLSCLYYFDPLLWGTNTYNIKKLIYMKITLILGEENILKIHIENMFV